MLETLLPHLKKILVWITLKRIIMLGLGSIVWIFSLTLFENRVLLFDAINDVTKIPHETTNLKLSDAIIKKMKTTVDIHPEVSFVMVVGASIARNQRELIYSYTNSPQIELEIQDFLRSNGPVSVLLSRNEESNVAIIRAINGEFACFDSASSIMVSSLNHIVKKICRISVPPYYGQFSGYLAFGITNDITPEQLAVLRHDVVEITSEIYFDNLKRLQR